MSSLFSIKADINQEYVEYPCLKTHRASFRTELEIDNKEAFLYGKKALLFISVGQAYHEDGKFFSTIDLVNKYDFQRCDIVMADTLQRHNFKGAMGADKAYEYTQKAGDLWLRRNYLALEHLKQEHRIIRWDELLFSDTYGHYRQLIDEEYTKNQDYQEALSSNASFYIDRLKTINPNISESELFANGLEYLIEEMPIVMPMWAEMGYEIIIYPKPQTLGMKKTYDLFVKESHPGKCLWMFLRFKKCKATSQHPTNNAFDSSYVAV